MSEIAPIMLSVLQDDGEVILPVTGSSMKPMLHHERDSVVIVKAPDLGLKKYDIALYQRSKEKYVMHRVVALRKSGYVMVGDNQCSKEYPVQSSQIVGVVKGFRKNGVYISCDNLWYMIYCRLWVASYPIRFMYVKAKRFYANHMKGWS